MAHILRGAKISFEQGYNNGITLREAWEGKEGFDDFLQSKPITMRDCYTRAMQAAEVRKPVSEACAPWATDNFY